MIFSLIENLEKLDIILASASPRRYEILHNMGLDFRVIPSKINEDGANHDDPQQYVKKNARDKGLSIAEKYPDSLVISGDTVVSINNIILEKPENEESAFQMLLKLSGKTHQVFSGYGLFLKHYDKELINCVTTDVTFRELSEDEIWAYVNTGEPSDKAGAYGIQGQAALFVTGINGCYFNVMGMPVAAFFQDLERFLKYIVL